MENKFAEAVRMFPHVYTCAILSLINRYPMLSSVNGLGQMLHEKAAEITYKAIEASLIAGQVEINPKDINGYEELGLLLSYVTNNVDYQFVDEMVWRHCQLLVLNGRILRSQTKDMN